MTKSKIRFPIRAALFALCAALVGASGASAADVDVFTGIGYRTDAHGPHLLIGGVISSGGIPEGSLAIRLSNVVAPEEGTSTVGVGLEGTWDRFKPPYYVMQLRGEVNVQQQGDDFSRSAWVYGEGVLGGVRGHIRTGMVEQRFTTFPWDQNGTAEGISEEDAYYHIEGGLAAVVLPSLGLRWSQDLAYQKRFDQDFSALSVSTGPEVLVGAGSLATQLGIVVSPGRLVPVARLRYEVRSADLRSVLRLAAETATLRHDSAAIVGTYTLAGEDVGVQAQVRMNRDERPTVYFSMQPKL